ncbi:unnamed protein product [Adineta steineri]|uniref:F-box domain-containing protein n=1 Tax=Adineta steineri TaxID=433720 RepID=A0A815P6N2_9BILA|nr:unnamed protein product [Adineta steineri]CAF1628875.1 unnamed protein product [Adineta steineri]
MTTHLLDLPNEVLEIITFYVIDGIWKNDVRDFLSFTSTCQRLYLLSHDEKYWKKMVARRDPINKELSENITWLDYCKQIYLMRTILPDELENTVSRYNDGYFCTIEKILLWPNKIRIYIDERGDNSLGSIQHPRSSKIAFVKDEEIGSYIREPVSPSDSHFSIEDEKSQYLGYLDFFIHLSLDHIEKVLVFQYGAAGYATIKLFKLEQAFLDNDRTKKNTLNDVCKRLFAQVAVCLKDIKRDYA